ncbi:hydroxyisourate hydrolase [Klenkia taihuensis]|uniref:5-hydroxyisourate hydrolase n=1 Tax=Klenkia taihuensis TaxID=1225127 RepID=A0A1I1G8W5_9ACTN|nr:hydroxyisourate hydrolase [Klenkia taihuensis]GHE09887.1 5-hydroxyisourate hydrolase [Klenkia taihuensis]SFC08139.1 5-hydroxyisourate hydrolase [Klenkia taihuensis]
MSVSTHVLDSVLGRPAAGMVVQLFAGSSLVAEGVTDADGRFRLADHETGTGPHRVVFATGPWFAEQGRETFYPTVSLDFTVVDGAAHHHVPLLLAPFAFSTYRGS